MTAPIAMSENSARPARRVGPWSAVRADTDFRFGEETALSFREWSLTIDRARL